MPADCEERASAAGERPRQVLDLEERTWLPRHLRGDRAAFAALLQAYRRPVYGYLVRAGVRAGERDDLFQAIFLKIHLAAASYQSARPLRPWLFTIVANTVRNHFRDARDGLVVALTDPEAEIGDPAPGPDRAAEARQLARWLEQAIAALPEAQREVLLLVTVADLPQAQVAEALGLPLNTVKTHLRRARLGLAAALARREAGGEEAGDEDEPV